MKSKNSFYNKKELTKLGLKSFGKNVLISRNANFYKPSDIVIGNNVRIDDFCILSGKIEIGSYVHISAYCALYGGEGIQIKNYSGLSPRVTIMSMTDDFSGDYPVGTMIPEKLRNVTGGKVIINKYVQIGMSSTVLPNLSIGEGVAVGSMSLVNKNLDNWGIYFGIPAKFYKKRSKLLLKFLKEDYD